MKKFFFFKTFLKENFKFFFRLRKFFSYESKNVNLLRGGDKLNYYDMTFIATKASTMCLPMSIFYGILSN